MAITQGEIDDAIELFSAINVSIIGQITTRKMMGGLTIFSEGRAFALYHPDQGYFLKSDKQTHAAYEAEGLARFVIGEKDGKALTMNYYAVPDSAYDDHDILTHWTRLALDAALRAKPKKR